MWDIWYIKDNKRTKEINKKEIVDNQFRKNLRKGGTDRQKDNIVSFIKDVIYKWNQDNLKSLKPLIWEPIHKSIKKWKVQKFGKSGFGLVVWRESMIRTKERIPDRKKYNINKK